MLTIVVFGKGARWDADAIQWTSSDKQIETVLNSVLPDEIRSHDAHLKLGGTQAIALKSARECFKDSLRIIMETETEEPAEKPGVDY